MNTARIPVESIVGKAHTWRRSDVNTYIASVDIGFNEYEDHNYSRTELVAHYGDLVHAIDATLEHATHPKLRGVSDYQRSTVCLARGIDMLRRHQVKEPIHYIDKTGAQQFINNIYEFYSYTEADDTVLLILEHYSLALSDSGDVFVDRYRESNVTLPMSLLEEHYPNCRGRLKAALGVGLKEDLSDAEFVQYVCQTDTVKAAIDSGKLPSDMLPA